MKIRLATQRSESAHTTPSASSKTRIRAPGRKLRSVTWPMAEPHDSQRISQVIELCGKQACSPPPTDLLAAAARSGGLAN